ncbi:unnamed protein product, partial [Gadus morhua 'NCC']
MAFLMGLHQIPLERCWRLLQCPYSWLNPLFRIGYKRTLEGKDLYNVLPENRSKTLGETLQRYWDEECLKTSKDLKEPSLSKAIICCHWKLYSVLGIFTFIE